MLPHGRVEQSGASGLHVAGGAFITDEHVEGGRRLEVLTRCGGSTCESRI